ncbi:hypothetical protein AX774_g3899, partial [Zancudomyces culisetae]
TSSFFCSPRAPCITAVNITLLFSPISVALIPSHIYPIVRNDAIFTISLSPDTFTSISFITSSHCPRTSSIAATAAIPCPAIAPTCASLLPSVINNPRFIPSRASRSTAIHRSAYNSCSFASFATTEFFSASPAAILIDTGPPSVVNSCANLITYCP